MQQVLNLLMILKIMNSQHLPKLLEQIQLGLVAFVAALMTSMHLISFCAAITYAKVLL